MSEKASWRLEEGDQIVPGRVAVKRLGGGKLYEVYLAWDDALYHLAVAKILRPDHAGHERSLRAIRREADLLARLAHPVIVRTFGGVLDGPRPHLVLEHLEGPTLSRLLRRYGPLPYEQVLPMALSLASALRYISISGYVHLDVKPSNLVMGAPPRLIDLSVARSIEGAATLTTAVGTRRYMSPEQCEPGRRGPIGPPADVWAVGMVMYQALTGELPFGDPEGVEHPQLDAEPRALDAEVPPVVAEVIMRCLAPDPLARPPALALARDLEPLVAATPRAPIGRKRPRIR
ncbi:MAG TPA: serine/threonine-protein kinase [Actinomycetota bacterium]